MQRSACRPVASDSTSVRPLSSRTRWKALRAVARRDARPDRGVGVHPLGGRRARQELEEHLQVGPGRDELLDAHDRDQHLGQGQAHPAVALRFDDDDRARVGDREVGARDGDPGAQELLAQVEPGGLGQLRWRVGQAGRGRPADPSHLVDEDVADLGPVAMDGGHEDVRGQVVAELDDHLGEVGLPDVDALEPERLVELDLLGRHRLDLDDLGRAGGTRDRRHDRVRLGRIARPVDGSAGRGDGALELLEERRQVAQDFVLDRGAGQPKRLPVGALGDDGGPLRADGRGRASQVRPKLVVGQRRPGRLGERRRAAERRLGTVRRRGRQRRADPPAPLTRSTPVEARISARCTTRTGDRRLDSSPPMCIRHDVSPAVRTSAPEPSDVVDLVEAHRDRRVGVLDRERPAEAAARLAIEAGRPG